MRVRKTLEYIPIRKNQVWVTDITYIPIWNPDGTYTFCYLSMITDCYTKEIISWYLGEAMEARTQRDRPSVS